MKRSRFTEQQIIGILKEHQAGLSAAELCRKHGVSEPTFYKWRSKYGGLEVSEAKRLRTLEEENARLKKLLAELMMDVSTLRELLGKTTDARLEENCRELGHDREELFSAARLCPGRDRPAGLPLSIHPRRRCAAESSPARAVRRAPKVRLPAPAPPALPRGLNWKKLYRIYREEKLTVRRRGGRKRALGTRTPMAVPQAPNQRWSLDFVSDALSCGRRFRVLCVIDDFSRECLATFADTSLPGLRVARELDRSPRCADTPA